MSTTLDQIDVWRGASTKHQRLEFKEAKNREKFGHFGLWLSLVERLVRDDSQMIFSLDPDLI